MSEENQRGDIDLEAQLQKLKKLLKFEFEFPQIHEKFLEENRKDNILYLDNVESILERHFQELCEYCVASNQGTDTLHLRRLSNSMLRTLLRLRNSAMTQFQLLTRNYDKAAFDATSNALSTTMELLSASHNHCSSEVLEEYNTLRQAYASERKSAAKLKDIRPYELEYLLRIANQQVEKYGIELDMQAILDEFYDSPITLSNESGDSEEDTRSSRESAEDDVPSGSRSRLTLTHTESSPSRIR